MFAQKPYQRLHAVAYAQKWALSRNPLFQDFAECGGDCTNFISQCIFAGSCVMNDTPTFGWYFRAPGNYAPAWTGVPFLYNFLTSNMENGPFAVEVPAEQAELGDIVQLGTRDGNFYHSLIITGARPGTFLVCAHNNDALDRRLDSYIFEQARFLHILGVRLTLPQGDCCYDGMLAGTSIFPTETQKQAGSCYPPADKIPKEGVPSEKVPSEGEPSAPSPAIRAASSLPR